ncbi:hypothetical protein BGZ70_004593, partial [Mortierella alpina]
MCRSALREEARQEQGRGVGLEQLEHKRQLAEEGVDRRFPVGEHVAKVGRGQGDDACDEQAQGADPRPSDEVVDDHTT